MSSGTGRIHDEDIALVRERASIADVVGEHLQLKNAGGGRLKGLCPFHDEKTPSFYVSPEQGFYKCFGCSEGGDVIAFVQQVEHLTFREAVERLAGRAGVPLRFEQGSAAPRAEHSQRSRLLAANGAAAEFYAEQLATSDEAAIGREELARRGFDQAAAAAFGVGYSPQGWDTLVRHLRGRGFTVDELRAAGLASDGPRGLIDRFRGRLTWPIADISGDLIAFGARRLYDDDRQEAKYLNTPETVLYKKSHVLYGLSNAKKEIARRRQAVVVEGYTDVMACHLAGVPTAVATCGTSFGEDHIKVLRRLLMDQDEFRGEVVFTFDGDAAGQKAALRAFADDQKFVTQTFVAVEPGGLDPCELRLAHGDGAVRDLIASRVPLSEFAIRSVLARYDLEIPEGRVQALHAAAPVVAGIKDRALRPEYARRLAGWLGMEVETVLARVGELTAAAGRAERGGRGQRDGRGQPGGRSEPGGRGGSTGTSLLAGPRRTPSTGTSEPAVDGAARPDPGDRELSVERETLKVAMQRPVLAGPVFDDLDRQVFTSPAYAAVRDAIAAAGGCARAEGGQLWVGRVRESAADELVRALATELAVEPIRSDREVDERYATAQLAVLEEKAVTRRTMELKSRVQRVNPVERPEEYNRLAGELFALEQYRRGLRERAIGTL